MSLTSSNPQKDTIRNDLLVCPWVRSQDLCGSEAFDDDHANGSPRLPRANVPRRPTIHPPPAATHTPSRSIRSSSSSLSLRCFCCCCQQPLHHHGKGKDPHLSCRHWARRCRYVRLVASRKASVSQSRILKGKRECMWRGRSFVRLDRWAAYPCRFIAAIDIPKRITMGIVRAGLIRSIDIGRSIIHRFTLGVMSQGAVRNLSLYFLPVRHLT
jgi:hypothetical protein